MAGSHPSRQDQPAKSSKPEAGVRQPRSKSDESNAQDAASTTRKRPSKAADGARSEHHSGANAPYPAMNLAHPERVADLAFLACFRGRKFVRGRFARLMQDRIGSSETTERFVLNVPIELLTLFLCREVRPVLNDRAPVNECFELPDGGMLEFAGDHMEAAETIARLLLSYDEQRLLHIVESLTEHDRSWLHTLAIEARDGRLADLGFADLDDVDRLFAPWHAQLLIRKLMASKANATLPSRCLPPSKVTEDAVLAYVQRLPGSLRHAALERFHFLAMCQAVRDAGRSVHRMTQANMDHAAALALRIIVAGLREAGGEMTFLAGPQVATLYRLGLAKLGAEVASPHEA